MLRAGPRPATLLMHPDDAARLALTAGHSVVITSAAGATTAVLEVNAAIRPGRGIPPYAWFTPGVNRLASGTDAVDSLTGMPRL